MLEMRSKVEENSTLSLLLKEVAVPTPADGDVLVRIDAAPINPSDLNPMLAQSDVGSAQVVSRCETNAPLSPQAFRVHTGRVGKPIRIGNEGAGVVVAAGAAPEAQALIGKTVGVIGGGMYTQFRALPAATVLPFPAGVTPRQAASWFVNPLTSLCMLETMRQEGHTAIVHTAAASQLGQMLVKICLADGVPLVNIVRSAAQVAELRDLGAIYVVDSSAASFSADLRAAVTATGATIAFDATGGGTLAPRILAAMEAGALANGAATDPYGSTTFKQVGMRAFHARGHGTQEPS